jgi:hypothetical protein
MLTMSLVGFVASAPVRNYGQKFDLFPAPDDATVRRRDALIRHLFGQDPA